ncbi:hypothetical protein DFO47_11720 [Arthrobacter sp. AG258]|uniref:hypothetical protein n=1 Tax=Arthrobacter sp. AG258 TaxID=2183899 RepID=UPI001060C603|nr:hypothetical protein [Arthrobacter sp. AG258]TDT73562.1 hypothetical protein DFO47_11720 [Arthrobacter sp. AG258]
MRPIETSTDRLRSGSLTYEPEAAAIWGGKITIDLPVDPPAPRQHLVKAATDQLLIGKHHESGDEWDDDWVDAPSVTIQNCIDKVANRHLQDATGSTAHIWLGAERLTALAILPTPLAERPDTLLPGPLFKEYAPEPETYLRHTNPRALTPDQKAILPAVVESVRDVLPPALQPHLDDISHLVAQEIPAAEDLLRAYQRASIPEVLAEYDRDGRPEPLTPEYQQAVKTAQLSFPRHATEALTSAAHAVAATPSKTAAGVAAGPAFDR